MRLVVSRDADDDMRQIAQYLIERNPAAAASIFDDINRKFVSLAQFPFIGRDRSGLRKHRRQRLRVVYRVEAERITILRVLHGRRDIDAKFQR
jgi:toxin ParE1/3/4